jgi:cytosine/adenosine deaminase-related metal-dependent hydrolase
LRDVPYSTVIDSLETIIRELNHTNGDRIRAFVGPYGLLPTTSASFPNPADKLVELTDFDKKQMKEMWRIARKYNTRIHTECYGGSIYLMYKDKENAILGPDVHLQHCSGSSFDEILILKETNTHVGLTFQSAVPNIMPMLSLGIKVGIGSDGPKLLGNADIFQCMRMVHNAQRDDEIFSGNDMFNLPPEKLVEMTTIEAAEVIGWDDEIGSLEVGKKADIVTINLLNSRMMPRFNVLDTIVMLGNGNDVDNVFVDGEQLLENGKVLSADEECILIEGEKEARSTLERAGLTAFIDNPKKFWGMPRRYPEEKKFDLEWQRRDGGYY